MPVYEYRCKSCGKTHEIEHGFHDQRPTECPSCGGELVRVFHPIGLVFKGSGFHKTDYGGSGARPAADTKANDAKGSDHKGEGGTAASSGSDASSSSSSGSTPAATSKAPDAKPSPGGSSAS